MTPESIHAILIMPGVDQARGTMTITTRYDFVVAEQKKGRYILHVFQSEEQFVIWRRQARTLKIVDPLSARGHLKDTIDHRWDLDLN